MNLAIEYNGHINSNVDMFRKKMDKISNPIYSNSIGFKKKCKYAEPGFGDIKRIHTFAPSNTMIR